MKNYKKRLKAIRKQMSSMSRMSRESTEIFIAQTVFDVYEETNDYLTKRFLERQ